MRTYRVCLSGFGLPHSGWFFSSFIHLLGNKKNPREIYTEIPLGRANRQDLLRKLEGGRCKGREREEREGRGEHEERMPGYGGRAERERKERDVLVEGAIMGLTRNVALEKFPGIHKDNLSP